MDSKANEWDRIYSEIPLEKIPWQTNRIPPSLVSAARGTPGRALDVCCGAGLASVYLAKRGFRVRGIDISPKALEIAKGRARQERVDVEFVQGDVTSLEADTKYDLIYDRGCFHHMTSGEKREFVERVYNALKEDGKYLLIAFSERNSFSKSVSREEIHRLFSGRFSIGPIEEDVHLEPEGWKVYLYNVLMQKKPANGYH